MTRTNYRWPEAVARLRKNPGRWVLTHSDVPVKAARRVRLRQHPALDVTDGRIDARIVNPYRDEANGERGSLWMRFTPLDPQPPRKG